MITVAPSSTHSVRFELRDVCFAYEAEPVVTDLSCTIAAGEFVGIIGSNGAGKTTLIRLLSGMLTPQAGVVLASGTAVTTLDARERARRIALVPQNESVVFPWSVFTMVLLGRHPHRSGLGFERPDDYAAARAAMVHMEIAHLAERSVLDLSGGELHRVIIARALAQDTPVLLLDEPSAHLDIRHQVALFELLSRLHAQEGRTVVIITHDLNLAGLYCDRIMLMDRGEIAAFASPAEVLREDIIARHFGVQVSIGTDTDTGRPLMRLRRPS